MSNCKIGSSLDLDGFELSDLKYLSLVQNRLGSKGAIEFIK